MCKREGIDKYIDASMYELSVFKDEKKEQFQWVGDSEGENRKGDSSFLPLESMIDNVVSRVKRVIYHIVKTLAVNHPPNQKETSKRGNDVRKEVCH